MKINNKNIFTCLRSQAKATFIVMFIFVFSSQVYAYYSLPRATGYVNDFAQMLTPQTKQNLENKLSLFEASSTNEIAVVTIAKLNGDTIENFAVKLFAEWKIGKEKQDNGILFLISRDDHKMRIEVGYGLEGALPDAKSSRILNQIVTPLFKEGKYDEGVSRAVDEIINATKDENYNISSVSSSKKGMSVDFWIFIIIFLTQGLLFIVSILGRSKSWWLGGVFGGVLGGAFMFWFGWSFIFGGAVTVFLIFFGLLFDYFVSKTYQKSVASGASIPWWIGGARGGGFGSSTGGGSSFGGFGGGSSGGGGASGSW